MGGDQVLKPGAVSHDLLPELHPLRFKDLPVTISASVGKFAEVVTKGSSAVIWNTTKCLVYDNTSI
ncbi:hypothetical protein PanWU01x14_353920 [Parasponia andersonii]|uniref:Uncharacterized protein n=1 Tax=Parasponia andersonii TaxID=3476 RepID=A0A2P5A9T8_PARAD|nr:hypothetical protein PanWU01x14_353920 [Parasponia andersonii]